MNSFPEELQEKLQEVLKGYDTTKNSGDSGNDLSELSIIQPTPEQIQRQKKQSIFQMISNSNTDSGSVIEFIKACSLEDTPTTLEDFVEMKSPDSGLSLLACAIVYGKESLVFYLLGKFVKNKLPIPQDALYIAEILEKDDFVELLQSDPYYCEPPSDSERYLYSYQYSLEMGFDFDMLTNDDLIAVQHFIFFMIDKLNDQSDVLKEKMLAYFLSEASRMDKLALVMIADQKVGDSLYNYIDGMFFRENKTRLFDIFYVYYLFFQINQAEADSENPLVSDPDIALFILEHLPKSMHAQAFKFFEENIEKTTEDIKMRADIAKLFYESMSDSRKEELKYCIEIANKVQVVNIDNLNEEENFLYLAAYVFQLGMQNCITFLNEKISTEMHLLEEFLCACFELLVYLEVEKRNEIIEDFIDCFLFSANCIGNSSNDSKIWWDMIKKLRTLDSNEIKEKHFSSNRRRVRKDSPLRARARRLLTSTETCFELFNTGLTEKTLNISVKLFINHPDINYAEMDKNDRKLFYHIARDCDIDVFKKAWDVLLDTENINYIINSLSCIDEAGQNILMWLAFNDNREAFSYVVGYLRNCDIDEDNSILRRLLNEKDDNEDSLLDYLARGSVEKGWIDSDLYALFNPMATGKLNIVSFVRDVEKEEGMVDKILEVHELEGYKELVFKHLEQAQLRYQAENPEYVLSWERCDVGVKDIFNDSFSTV